MIPRGRYIGKPLGNHLGGEAEHFIRCPACDGWIDCRDLACVLEHEGPCPIRRRIDHNDQEKTSLRIARLDGRIIHSAEIERIHKEVLDFKHIEAISEPMRELIEDLWPELVSKPPKRRHSR